MSHAFRNYNVGLPQRKHNVAVVLGSILVYHKSCTKWRMEYYYLKIFEKIKFYLEEHAEKILRYRKK